LNMYGALEPRQAAYLRECLPIWQAGLAAPGSGRRGSGAPVGWMATMSCGEKKKQTENLRQARPAPPVTARECSEVETLRALNTEHFALYVRGYVRDVESGATLPNCALLQAMVAELEARTNRRPDESAALCEAIEFLEWDIVRYERPHSAQDAQTDE
jgi:hypothetical protein